MAGRKTQMTDEHKASLAEGRGLEQASPGLPRSDRAATSPSGAGSAPRIR